MWLRYLLSDRRVRYLLKDRPVTVAIDVTNKTTVTSPTLGPAEPPLLPQLNHLQACHQFSAWRWCRRPTASLPRKSCVLGHTLAQHNQPMLTPGCSELAVARM